MADIMIFKRYEMKYRLNAEEYTKFMSYICDNLVPDKYGRNTLCSLYLDTPDYRLIRDSINAVSYKEKLRLRSYGVPSEDKKIFFEIKNGSARCPVVQKERSCTSKRNGTAVFFAIFGVWFDEKYGFLLVSVAILAII